MSQAKVVKRPKTACVVCTNRETGQHQPYGTVVKSEGGTYWVAKGLSWKKAHPKQADAMSGGWLCMGRPTVATFPEATNASCVLKFGTEEEPVDLEIPGQGGRLFEPSWEIPFPAEEREKPEPYTWHDSDLPIQQEDGWFIARKEVWNPKRVHLGQLQGPRVPRKDGEFGSRDRRQQNGYCQRWFKAHRFPSTMAVEDDNRRERAAAARDGVEEFPLTPYELKQVRTRSKPLSDKFWDRSTKPAAQHWMVYSALGHDGQGGNGGFKIEALANII